MVKFIIAYNVYLYYIVLTLEIKYLTLCLRIIFFVSTYSIKCDNNNMSIILTLIV